MFTGLVEEMGKVVNISKKATGLGITIKGDKVVEKAKIGDSIAVNGVCLTVTEISGNISFSWRKSIDRILNMWLRKDELR